MLKSAQDKVLQGHEDGASRIHADEMEKVGVAHAEELACLRAEHEKIVQRHEDEASRIHADEIEKLGVAHAEKLEHYARAVKLVQNQLESKPNSLELEQKLIKFYEKLEWDHCTRLARESLSTRFPNDYELH